MNADTIGEIIATRKLYYFDDTNQKRIVSVFVGKPEAVPDSSDYQCPFQLVGIGTQDIHSARGHDSLQAFQAALILVAASVNYLNDQLGRKLIWENGIRGELGFP